jgi:hypothetical protein
MRQEYPGANYGFMLPDGTSGQCMQGYIQTTRGRVEFPGENLLRLDGALWRDILWLVGEGNATGHAWLWNGTNWADCGPTHGVGTCAFGRGVLCFSILPDTFRSLDLDTWEVTEGHAAFGSQGIRYVNDQNQPVPGDAAMFDGTVHEFTDRGDVRVGQGHDYGTLINGRLLEGGDCYFPKFKRDGDRLGIYIVQFKQGRGVGHLLTRAEVDAIPPPFVDPPLPPIPDPPLPPEPEPVSLQAPNEIATVRRVMAEHPEINTLDESQRGRILDFCAMYLNAGGTKWGRKSRNREGTDLNTDALTYLRPDGLFEIYDVISGANGGATWDGYGPFSQGTNGYWVEAPPANGTPGGVPDPPPPPAVDLSGIVQKLAELSAGYADLVERLTKIEQAPASVATLPKLRVKGRTLNKLYHWHDVDLEVEVIPE